MSGIQVGEEVKGLQIPVIDISGYYSGSYEKKLKIAKEIDAAWKNIGFLVIEGHQVSEDLVARAHKVSREFYDLPESIKLKYTTSPSVYRGYIAMGGLAAGNTFGDRKTAPDYREMFTMSRENCDPSDPYYGSEEGKRVFSPNVWPVEVTNFKEIWLEYYSAMDKLGKTLMHLFALGLDLPEDWFDSSFDKHMSVLAVTNYPDQASAPTENQLRCGAHTDYGALTILKSENKPGGLEVMSKDGKWLSVPMVPGTYVINLGDLMARWTNDRWVSNLHRVANPPRDLAMDSRRQSLICFFHPNYDAKIECLPSCTNAQGSPKYPPVRTREYLLAKIARQQET